MNEAFILLPTLLIYMGALYWIAIHFNFKGIWRGDSIELVQKIDKPMLNFVKGLLDFFMGFLCLVAVIIVPATLVLALSQGSSLTWGIDISIFAGFSWDFNAISGMEANGLRHPEISGKTMLSIDTSNVSAFYLFMTSQAALTAVGLYGVTQIRFLVISLKNGNAFCADNAARLRKIGLLVIVWNIVSPIFQYFAWGTVISDISFSNEGFRLYPAFEFDVMAIFIGAMMMILSDLFLEATIITQDQRLTI